MRGWAGDMRYILGLRWQEILRRYARSDVLLGFDYDGTLAPIVRRPELAGMRPSTAQLLAELARTRICTAVSGRSRDDLAGKLDGVGITHLIGNHGAEPNASVGLPLGRRVRGWQAELERTLEPMPGLWIENKLLSLTVHYRQCADKRAAHAAIVRTAAGLPAARLIPGKDAVSIVAPDAPNKGTALAALAARLGLNHVLYVGDDGTDEDVFTLRDPRLELLSIRVGPGAHSAAAYYLRDQREIDVLLQRLVCWSAMR